MPQVFDGEQWVSVDFIDILRLKARVEAIEARQRANNIHDPGCHPGIKPVFPEDNEHLIPVDYVHIPCNCWLSKEPEDAGA